MRCDGARPLTSDLRNLASDAGAVAQLGERLICIQEVVGSTPIGSIPDDRCRMTDARTLASRVKLFFDVRERCLSSDICSLTSGLLKALFDAGVLTLEQARGQAFPGGLTNRGWRPT